MVAADGRGRWRMCEYRGAAPDGGSRGGGAALLEPVGPVLAEPRAEPELTVAFAPAKGDRPEWVVQKLTELGIDRIVPLSTERGVVRWDGERARRALERLRRVAVEAAAQSRRVWLPEVTGLTGLSGLRDLIAATAERTPAGAPGLALAQPGAPALALAQPGGPAPGPSLQAVAVGPEGGWAPSELGLGLPEVGLGPHVLRAETAALAAAVVLSLRRDATVSAVEHIDQAGAGPGGEA